MFRTERGKKKEIREKKSQSFTYLPRARMQHPNILPHHHRHQPRRLHIPNLDKIRLKRQDIRTEDGKRRRVALPVDDPLLAGAPAVAVDEEAKVGVAEQKLRGQPLDVDGLDGLAAGDEVERSVGLVEQRLRFERLERDDFEAARAADAEFGFEEVDAVGVGGDVEFLGGW